MGHGKVEGGGVQGEDQLAGDPPQAERQAPLGTHKGGSCGLSERPGATLYLLAYLFACYCQGFTALR